jgi:hypothetical protein
MKTSEKYLRAHTDEYASFGYKEGSGYTGTYSEPGIEVEQAEVYGEICRLEAQIELLERFLGRTVNAVSLIKDMKRELKKLSIKHKV